LVNQHFRVLDFHRSDCNAGGSLFAAE